MIKIIKRLSLLLAILTTNTFAQQQTASGALNLATDAVPASVREFSIDIPDAALQDLQTRLALTRLPDQISGTTWEYGTDRDFLEGLINYWQNDFDWRDQEQRLNQFDQYITQVAGQDIHFIHQRSPNPDAIPLLVLHGWPGSIAEFKHVIGPLTDPASYGGSAADAFHVVAPSLPGFGFSQKPDERGFSPEKIAHLMATLMDQLGYQQYGLQGGDWGAIINRYLAGNYPDRLLGMHSNFILAGPTQDADSEPSAEELRDYQQREAYMQNERGYQQIQGTKPQSLGYALNDSPAGLAAWIAEKFHGWSDIPQQPRGVLLDKINIDDLLTNISIYWFTETITSSMRIYYENRNNPPVNPINYVSVPTAAAQFPAEISLAPRAWAEARYNIIQWTEMPRGGHFAALEEPELLIEDVRSFYRQLR